MFTVSISRIQALDGASWADLYNTVMGCLSITVQAQLRQHDCTARHSEGWAKRKGHQEGKSAGGGQGNRGMKIWRTDGRAERVRHMSLTGLSRPSKVRERFKQQIRITIGVEEDGRTPAVKIPKIPEIPPTCQAMEEASDRDIGFHSGLHAGDQTHRSVRSSNRER